jgi:plasmid maintenance system antidote protein VapI
LKQFLVIVLSSILLLPSFGNIIVYAKFKINQDEIAKTICIQRKLAKNTCNGRCELQKSLKKFADNEKEMQNNLKEKSELVYIQNTLEQITPIAIVSFSAHKNYFLIDKKPISVVLSNFRPPSYFI